MTLQEVDDAIAALEKALASGSEMVRFADGSSRTYKSSKDIRDNLEYFRNRRAELTGATKRLRPSVVRFS